MKTNELHKNVHAEAADKLCDLYSSVQESTLLLSTLLEGEYWEPAAKAFPQVKQQIADFGQLLHTIREGADKLAEEREAQQRQTVAEILATAKSTASEPKPPTEATAVENTTPPGGPPPTA